MRQMGYVTPELEASLDSWIDVADTGPFYFAEYEPERQVHRGEPTPIHFRLADTEAPTAWMSHFLVYGPHKLGIVFEPA